MGVDDVSLGHPFEALSFFASFFAPFPKKTRRPDRGRGVQHGSWWMKAWMKCSLCKSTQNLQLSTWSWPDDLQRLCRGLSRSLRKWPFLQRSNSRTNNFLFVKAHSGNKKSKCQILTPLCNLRWILKIKSGQISEKRNRIEMTRNPREIAASHGESSSHQYRPISHDNVWTQSCPIAGILISESWHLCSLLPRFYCHKTGRNVNQRDCFIQRKIMGIHK